MCDEDLNIIFENNSGHLEILDASFRVHLTEVSLSSIYIYFPCLETLLARWCKGYADSGSCNLQTDKPSVSRSGLLIMKRLKSVDFSDCGQITGSSFTCKDFGDFKMHEVQSIRIGCVGSLNSDVLVLIPYFAPQLRILDISRSSDDETVKLLIKTLTNTLRFPTVRIKLMHLS